MAAPAAEPIGWLFLVTAACLFLSTDGGYRPISQRPGRLPQAQPDPLLHSLQGR